jgi:hypothetical protein
MTRVSRWRRDRAGQGCENRGGTTRAYAARMRAFVLSLMFGFAACGGAAIPAPDAAVASCPATMPPLVTGSGSACTTQGQSCSYGDEVCDCRSGDDLFWYCRSTSCPAPGQATGACSNEGLSCTYGFEDTCDCDSGQWTCFGGTPPDAG